MYRDLSGVLDAVLAGILVLDEDGRIELVNSAASRILATSAEAAMGEPIEWVQGAGHALARLARSVLRSGRSAVEGEHEIERRLLENLVVDVAVSPLFEDGDLAGAVVVLRDRTIQRTLEQQVSERESLSAFGRIAAGIAHEVKNPLGGIRGAAEILASRTEDRKSRDAAEMIVREVDRIAGLVNDLMVFTHGDDLRFSETNIHIVLDGVLDLLAVDPLSSKIALERIFDPSLPPFLADPDRLTQVFLNLSRNAMQAMEGGGVLRITTKVTLDHRLSAESGEPLPTLLVEIEDTGPGIDAETLGKLSTPFFTTRDGGTGLGLAVSRQWVARHGGTLRIASTPGVGTTARVALPLRREP